MKFITANACRIDVKKRLNWVEIQITPPDEEDVTIIRFTNEAFAYFILKVMKVILND